MEVKSVISLHRMATKGALSREEANSRIQGVHFGCYEHAEPAAAAHDCACSPLVGWILCLFVWTTQTLFSHIATTMVLRYSVTLVISTAVDNIAYVAREFEAHPEL